MTSPADRAPRTHYPGLDLIRFAAALMVAMYHLGFNCWTVADDAVAAQFRQALGPAAPLLSAGWVGVPIFFTLSGFVIAASAEGRSVGRFVAGRAARLYPAAWLCTGLTAIAIAPDPEFGRKLAASLLLFPLGPWVSGVYWTLAIEIAFYALVAALIATRRAGAFRALGPGLAIAGSVFWMLRLLDFATGRHLNPVFAWFETPLGGLLLLDNAAHFAFGLLLWSWTRAGPDRHRAALLVACLAAGLIGTAASARFNVVQYHEPAVDLLVAPALYLAGAAAVVLAVLGNDRVARVLRPATGAIRQIGLLTYPLYLVHREVGAAVMRHCAALGGWAAFGLALVAVLLLALAVLRLERYPRALIVALTARRPRPDRPASDLP